MIEVEYQRKVVINRLELNSENNVLVEEIAFSLWKICGTRYVNV